MNSERAQADRRPEVGQRRWPGPGPSATVDWHPRRPFVISLTVAGFVVSAYLAIYQLGLGRVAWDPFFGSATDRVLRSSFARGLPVPDTVLGAVAYVVEGVLASFALRPGSRPGVVIAFGLLGLAMAATGMFLVLVQAFVVHAWCTLCLVSAAISIIVGALAARELRSTLAEVVSRDHDGGGTAAAG
jgi:hypothetical protein